jgi:pseudouridine 5'-phosphatase
VAAPAERAASAHLLSFFPDIPLTIDDYITQRNAAQDAHWPHVQLLPGVARLVAHLAAHNVPIAIATGSSRRNIALKTSHLQHVFAHFGSNVICASDDGAGRSKPFPDVFLAAARKLGRAVGSSDEEGDVVEREERARGLVFEDAFPGVMGGKRAGMSGAFIHLPHPFCFLSSDFPFLGVVVWVPDENLLSVDSSQLTEKPDQVLRSLEAFVPEEWSLPPFDDVPVSQQSGKEE